MEISRAITSVRKILISFDSWKIITGIIKIMGWYGYPHISILPYRVINKAFSTIILECITEVSIRQSFFSPILKKLNILLSRPFSLHKLTICIGKSAVGQKVLYDLICGSKEMRIFQIYVTDSVLVDSEGLKRVVQNCTNIAKLDPLAERKTSLMFTERRKSSTSPFLVPL
jgi:hypothetical protein